MNEASKMGSALLSLSDEHLPGTRYTPYLAMLRGIYPSLTPAERRVADFVFANPEWILGFSMAELAHRSGAGFGTVARLCGKLGYAGFAEMKIALAVELLTPDRGTPGPVFVDDDASTVVQKILRFGVQNLTDTAALIDPHELTRAAQALAAARRIECYAMSPTASAVAYIVQYRCIILGIPCAVFAHPQQQVMSAGLLREDDVAIGISRSGENRPVIEALTAAIAAEATTICITNAPSASITRVGAIRLLTAARDTQIAHQTDASHIAMLGVVETLYAFTLLLRYRQQEESPSAPETNATCMEDVSSGGSL